jgi:hypothetical protein
MFRPHHRKYLQPRASHNAGVELTCVAENSHLCALSFLIAFLSHK